MNIEEERKAFEREVLKDLVSSAVVWDGKQYTFYRSGGGCMTQDYFDIWLAAKAHAEEMAKPACLIGQTMGGNYGMFKPEHIRPFNVFATLAEAKQWAKDNGYRVVGE